MPEAAPVTIATFPSSLPARTAQRSLRAWPTGELFKTGMLVSDLARAMSDLGRWLELRWTPVQQSALALWTGQGRSNGSSCASSTR